jgi:hypothetical protein
MHQSRMPNPGMKNAQRIRNFGPDLQHETMKVLVPPAKAART